MKKTHLNKLLSILLIFGSVFYYIPKTISMVRWLNSGVISGYFYILAPVNIIIIGLAIISLSSFKNRFNSQFPSGLMTINVIGVILMVIWFPIIYGS